MITCKDAVSGLWEYLDRNIGQVREAELEEHLGLCRHCCGELEFAKQVRELLRRPSPRAELTPEARGRLEAFLKTLGREP